MNDADLPVHAFLEEASLSLQELGSLSPEQSSTLWLDHPSHLYLTDAQADAYLALMGDQDYSRSFHQPLCEIIVSNCSAILDSLDSPLLLVDLGPGYPDKSLPILEYLREKELQCLYVPVDINKKFLSVAADAVRSRGFTVSPINCLFEDLAPRIGEVGYLGEAGSRIVMLGLTFMNYRPDDILSLVSRLLRPQDRLLVATELTDSSPPVQIVRSYETATARKFTFAALELLGINEEAVDYQVSFRGGRVEVSFVLKQELRLMGGVARVGTRIVIAISYRYSLREFQDLLAARFTSRIVLSDAGLRAALAIVGIGAPPLAS